MSGTGRRRPDEGDRTTVTGEGLGWLTERQRDGGVDRIELPVGTSGELWLCGKHAVATRFERGEWDTIVCLVERHELDGRYVDYLAWLDARPSSAIWLPIHDLHVPTLDAMSALVAEIVARLRADERVLVHCAAGMGRAGTTAACVLAHLGLDIDEALAVVARCRPGAGPEAGVQLELVHALATGSPTP
jgi:hypothetical protein